MTLQIGKQVNCNKYIGQLIDHNMRNIFLEISYTKCGGETIPRPFSKKSKLSTALDQYLKIVQFVFILCQIEGYRNILKLKLQSTCFYLI